MKTRKEKLTEFLNKNYIPIYGNVIIRDSKTGLIGVKRIPCWYLIKDKFKIIIAEKDSVLVVYEFNTGVRFCDIQCDEWEETKINNIIMKNIKKMKNKLNNFININKKTGEEEFNSLDVN